jgi:Na+/proline symporter
MNCLILGWVTKALVTIVAEIFHVSQGYALGVCVLVLIPFTGFYVALGGLWGVLWTDLFQFVLKMGVVIALAYYALVPLGGVTGLMARLGAERAAHPGAANPLDFLPNFSHGLTAEPVWTLPVLSLLVNLAVQWWAFWYPGAEPGGGGYIAQRIFSAKDERHGLLSVLWFNVAHYAVRPWPWILTALAVIVLYPNNAAPEGLYIRALNDHLPAALRGLAIAGFLAAFMSTVATQLNWGASYLVADFYRRFVKPDGDERHYVIASRIATVILVIAAAFIAAQLASIKSGWQFVLEAGAGTGLVYILRWYWWRINAWSEISAMVAALVTSMAVHFWDSLTGHPAFTGSDSVLFAKSALTTTAVTTVVWLAATFLTAPESDAILLDFYRKVRPHVSGWERIAARAPEVRRTHDLGANLVSWVVGCAMVYCTLFGTGKLIFKEFGLGVILLLVAAICAWVLGRQISRMTASETAGAGAAQP